MIINGDYDVPFPIPQSTHNFCGNCNIKYDDYLEHIYSGDHLKHLYAFREAQIKEIDLINMDLQTKDRAE